MRHSTFYIFWLIAISVIGAEDFGSRYQSIMANEDGAGENVRLKRLFDTRWQYLMTENPEFATESGFVGQNDRWTDLSMTAIERRKRELQTPLAVLNAIDRGDFGLTWNEALETGGVLVGNSVAILLELQVIRQG